MIERKEEKINFIDQQIQSIFSLLKSLKIRNNPSDQKLLNSTKKELEKLYKKKQKLFNEFSNEYILEDYKSNVLKLDVQNAIKKITPHAIQEQYSKLHNIDSVTKEGHGSQFIIDIKRGSGWVISIQDSQKTGNEYTSPKVDPDPDKFDGEAYKNSHIAALEKAFEGEKEWMLLAETVLCQTPFNWMGSPISVMKFQTGDESQGGFPIINLNDSVHFRNVDTTDGIRKSFMTINRNTEGKIISLDFQTLMEIPVSHSIKPGDKNASPLATIHTKLNFSLSFNDKDKTPQIGNIKFEHKLD